MAGQLTNLALLLVTMGVGCLKVKVEVPKYKLRGELAMLDCKYQLEGDSLYSVKWYKENEEFYRYLPKSNPKQLSYRVEGIRVDLQLSDSRQVALRGVNLKSTGLYRCEVSAEGPSFASAQSQGRMHVLFLPNSGPHITGEEKHYQIGDEINLNCTSGKSSPASHLEWYINEQKVTDPNCLVEYENTVHEYGLTTSVLGLKLTVSAGHFNGGSIRLKCVASVSPVLWQADSQSLVHRTPPLQNREALLLVKGSGSMKSPSLCISLFLTVLLVAFTR